MIIKKQKQKEIKNRHLIIIQLLINNMQKLLPFIRVPSTISQTLISIKKK
jgi:transposase-like protein